ncbi:MAG: Ig-like domain-containing protein [Thermodesulfovibrionales bacterium]
MKKSPSPAPSRTKAVESKGPEIPQGPAGQIEAGLSENHPPVKSKADLLLKNSGGKDLLRVEITVSDIDDDDVFLEYSWFKNGEPVEVAGDTMRDFNRGDRIMVEVIPYDGLDYGGAKRTLEMEINNTSPQIIEHSDIKFDGKFYKYGVKAVDADGDKLTYELKKGPEGMAIDNKTGLITWKVPEDFTGSAEASVVVSDGHNGSVQYGFTASISEAPPKK